MATRDPREIITPDAFTVAPGLLGRPLAGPWRRGAALALDGMLVAILSNAPSVGFAIMAAFVLFRASAPSARVGFVHRSVRVILRLLGAIVLFVLIVIAAERLFDRDDGEDAVPADTETVSITGTAGVRALAETMRLRRAESEEEASAAAERLAQRLLGEGIPPENVAEVLREAAYAASQPAVTAAERVAASLEADDPDRFPASLDSLASAYAAAVTADDSAAVSTLGARLRTAIAADTVAALQARILRLRQRNERLEDELDRETGFIAFVRETADDLGFGLGWAALYFTAFLVLWRGQTPGKRLLGLRVVRLNGGPITWWFAFERFGGYAAGVVTGLLGFAQILWDANRQGVHDKIVQTVVVRER